MEINPKFKKVALEAAEEAGEILRRNFRKVHQISFKKDHSLVTEIDLRSEKAVIRLIKSNFPSHDILSEESGGRIGEKYTWIIDPLDGTTNYAKNIPFFSVSLALLYEREPILGVVLDPLNKELYFAEKGKGSFLNGRKIKVGQQKDLSKTVVLFNKYRTKDNFLKMQSITGLVGGKCSSFRILGSIILSLCYLASGKVDAFFSTGHNIWDLAAGCLIIKEAGGKITDLKGKDWQIKEKDVIAANRELHRRLLKLIK